MKEKGVPLAVTYDPNFKNLSFLIRKNLQFLYANTDTKRVFTPAPFVCFQSVRNLKSFLVRSKSIRQREKWVLQNSMVNAAKCV